jgi:EAL domain-containing protein (putative c-di-GMP-specific phosphodiesterase class I)
VAEGVESAEEATRLQALGCVFAQGYHFHRPLWPEEVERLLEPAPADN